MKNFDFILCSIFLSAVLTFSCNDPAEKKAKASINLFTIELNSISPGQYDPAAGNWVQTTENGSEVIFRYTLKNKIKTIPGKITANIGNIVLLSSAAFPNTVPELEADQNLSGEFHSYKLPPGSYELYFTYSKRVSFGPGGRESRDSIIAKELFYYFVPPDLVDNDLDAIDDREEKRLLDKYTPFFKFSKDGNSQEAYRPTDVLTYIRGSRLITGTDEDDDDVQVNNADLAAVPNKLFFTLHTTIPPVSTNLNSYVEKVPTSYYIDQAQNNIVRFKQDPVTLQFTHPVVYIEYGAHEFYPTEYWKFLLAPNHDGTDIQHSYFCAVPPNLGEVEHPLLEYEGATLIMQFSGYWGAFSSLKNKPGPGPSLHAQWTYPASSSIGWQLHNLPH